LHHAKSKLCFQLMHMFEIFESEIVVWLDLNSKDKIKRKEIRNLKEKGKTKAAQPSLPSAIRPTRPSAHPPLSPSARQARPVGTARPRARIPALPMHSGPGERELGLHLFPK
jgi:hypothetical protein